MAWKGGDRSTGGKRSGCAAGFIGLGDYLAGSKERGAPDHRIVAFGSNTAALDVHHAMREMHAVAEKSRRVKKPVFHYGFSLPKDPVTGRPLEHLDPEQWQTLVYHSLRSLGLDEHQAAWVVHEDAGHQHVHVVANRVPVGGGRAWRPSHDHPLMRKTARWAEIHFDLSRHAEPERTRPLRRTDREHRAILRSGEATPWSEALPAFREATSWRDLGERLAADGFTVAPSQHHAGGLVLRHGDGPSKALGQVHPALTGPKLTQRFGESFAEHVERLETPPSPAAVEREALTVDRLVDELASHHAVWTETDARRAARPFPSAAEVLGDLWSSERVLEVGPGLYTTPETVRLEERTFELAGRAHRRGDHRVPPATGETLAGEHLEAVRAAVGEQGLFILQGPPGSGKTTAARAVADSYRSAGYEIYGAAVTGKAAEGLQVGAGIESRTLASWRKTWERQGPDGPGKARRVMIVDEASMLSLQDAAPLLERASKDGTKLVLIGDVQQLPPVGAGDPYRRLLEEYGGARLTEIHRQREGWMRDASDALVRGDARGGLQAYDDRGHVHWTETTEDARTSLVMQYFEDRLAAPDQSSLLIAYRNTDVRAMNEQIRTLRRERGELADGYRLHSKEFAAGDRVLFRRNERRVVYGAGGEAVAVQNGTLGTLVEAGPDRIAVRLDSGVRVHFDPTEYSDLDYGYAVTLHKAQGATVDRAYVLVDRHVDAAGFLVASTRHRHHLELYVAQDQFRGLEDVETAIVRRRRPDLVRDHVDPSRLPSPIAPERPEAEQAPDVATVSAPDVAAVELELRRVTARTYRCRSGEELVTEERLRRLEDRVEGLREDLEVLPESAERRHRLARVTELVDQFRYQLAGGEVLRTSWEGLLEERAAAIERYRALPAPRLLPEPPKTSGPAEDLRPLPEGAPEELISAVRKFEAHAYRMREGSARSASTAEDKLLLRQWGEEAVRAEVRLDRAVELAESYAEGLQRLESIPEGVSHAPEAAAEALRLSDLERRIYRLTHLRRTPRQVLAELDLQVMGEDGRPRPEPTTALDELGRAWKARNRWDALQARKKDFVQSRKDSGLPSYAEYRRELERLDHAPTTPRIRRHFDRIYTKPARAFEHYREHLRKGGVEAVEAMLREEPETFGRLQGLVFKGRPRESAVEVAEELGRLQEQRADLEERHRRSEEIRTQLVEIQKEQDVTDRRQVTGAIYRHGLSLSRQERKVLPEPVRATVEKGRVEQRRLEVETRRLLKEVTRLGVGVAKGQAERLLPRPARRVLNLVRSLRALHRNAPAYLVGRLMPPPLRLAIYVIRGAARALERSRGRGWSP